MIDSVIALVLGIAFVMTFLGMGNLFLSFFRAQFTPLEKVIFSFGIGAAFMGFAMFLFGALQLFNQLVFYLLLVISFLVGLPNLIKLYTELLTMHPLLQKRGYVWIFVTFSLLFLALLLVTTFSPVIEWDSLSYHLAIPKMYLQHGGITYIPFIPHSNWPLLIEMLYLLGLGLSSAMLAKLIAFSFLSTLVLATYQFGKRFFNKPTGIIAATLLVSLPIINQFGNETMVDIPLAFFQLVSLYALFQWCGSNKKYWLVLAALFAGFAAASKITGFVFIPILLLIILFKTIFVDKHSFIKGVYLSVLFGFIAFLFLLPFLIKTFIFTGNPVWPFLYPLLGGKDWSSALIPYFNYAAHNYGFGRDIFGLLLLPWNLTMHSSAFGSIMGISFFFLAFLPLYFFMKKSNVVHLLFFYAIGWVFIWFLLTQQNRILIPVLSVLSLITAYVVFHLLEIKKLKNIMLTVLVLGLAFHFVLSFAIHAKQIPVAIGLVDEEAFIQQHVSHYAATQFINGLPGEPKILLFTEKRGFYLEKEYVWGDPIDQGYLDYFSMQSPEGLYQDLNRKGITHLLMDKVSSHSQNDLSAADITTFQKTLVDPMLENYGTVVYEDEHNQVYALYP